LLTEITLEKEMNAVIAKIEALKTVTGKVNRIRLETLK
jgi:homoserine dehydrogenase